MVIYNQSTLHQWHSNRNIVRNEQLSTIQRVRDGYFSFYNGKWVFVNENLTSLKDVSEDKEIQIGSFVELNNGKKLLLSNENGGRVAIVSLANKY